MSDTPPITRSGFDLSDVTKSRINGAMVNLQRKTIRTLCAMRCEITDEKAVPDFTAKVHLPARFALAFGEVTQASVLAGKDGKPALKVTPVALFDCDQRRKQIDMRIIVVPFGAELATDHDVELLGAFIHPIAGLPIAIYRASIDVEKTVAEEKAANGELGAD